MIRILALIAVVASALGASTLSVGVAGFQLSVFRTLIIIMLVLAFTRSPLSRLRPAPESASQRSSSLQYPHYFMAFWLIVSIFSVAWSLDRAGWVRGTFFVFIGTATVFLFRYALPRLSDLMLAFRLMAVVAIIHNFVGWYEVLTGNLLFLQVSTEYYIENQFAASTFGNTNNYATYLLVSITPLLISARASRSGWMKLIFVAGAASSALLILNSESRANMIALVLWAAVTFLLQFRTKMRATAALLVLSATIAVALFIDTTAILHRLGFEGIFNFTFGNTYNSDGVRLNLILNGLHFVGETYGFGTGAGNIEYWMEHTAPYPTLGVANIHNWWIEILASFGIVVFLGYVAMFLYLLSSLFASATRANGELTRDTSALLMAGLAAFAIGSISSSSNLIAEWLWLFFAVVINYAAAAYPRTRRSEAALGKDQNH